jgi:IMP dehydrogenase
VKQDSNTRDICFDDILLVPNKHSSISSRNNISLETKIGNPANPNSILTLHRPFIIAPMEYISSKKMINSIAEMGGLGFVHRFQNIISRLKLSEELLGVGGFAISVSEANDRYFINDVVRTGTKVILIDTAFGHTELVLNAVRSLRSFVPDSIHIMVGNVSSYAAYKSLMDSGADSVRVGIGGGASCTTRVSTGFGVPVLASIMDIYDHVQNDTVNGIVADSGIKNNGDIVKALAGGASAVMMGSIFAGHSECDGINEDGTFNFRGLASKEIQIDNLMPGSLNVEGVSGKINPKGSVIDTLTEMIGNVSSGISYSGYDNIKDFQHNVEFIKVSSQTVLESQSRI